MFLWRRSLLFLRIILFPAMSESSELARLVARLATLRCPVQAVFADSNILIVPSHERMIVLDWLLSLYAASILREYSMFCAPLLIPTCVGAIRNQDRLSTKIQPRESRVRTSTTISLFAVVCVDCAVLIGLALFCSLFGIGSLDDESFAKVLSRTGAYKYNSQCVCCCCFC
jgi:hypothetical protein